MRFCSTLGRLPGTWSALVIIVLSGMAEGVGLILFVPLLEIMIGGSVDEIRSPFDLIVTAFQGLGIPVTTISMLFAITAFLLGSLALGYAQNHMLIRSEQAFILGARNRLVDNLFHASWNYISNQSHGDVVNKLVTEALRAGAALRSEVQAVAALVQIVIFFIFSAVISWQLMTMTLVFGGVLMAVVRPLHKQAKGLGNATTKANKDLGFHGLEFLRSSKLIKVTATEDSVISRLAEYIQNLYYVNFRSRLNPVRVYFIIQSLPVLFFSVLIAISHDVLGLDPSSTLVFLLFLARIAPKVGQFQQQMQSYAIASPGIEAVEEMTAASRSARESVRPDGVTFENLTDRLAIEGLSFAYPGSPKKVLDGIDMSIGRNQMVAIVGKSGAGKSTLIDLLAGLRVPDSGRIAIDGVDLGEMNLDAWRRRIGYVTQDIVIFNDTVLNNLIFAHPETPREMIEDCIRLAHFSEVIAELPQGLDTVLGEGGVRLSGGQKQRLALARALIGPPQLLFLDEATSSLDNESERLIQDSIDSIAHTMTIVVIAHRLSTVRKADVIYVLEGGRVVESGNYESLLSDGNRFAEFHKLQFS